MKHLKRFNEELLPQTYRSAAWKLRDYNKSKKSQNLLDWADKQEFGYYNMCLVNSSSVIAKNDTFTNPKLIGMYYGDVKSGERNKPIYGEDVLRHSDSEALANRLVNDWKEGRAELAITFEFGFQATSQTKAKHEYLNNPSKFSQRWNIGQSVPMFSIELQLSDLERVGELGYVEGISNIIVKNLKELDITQRPVHCTDKKREVLYIKDEDKWEKDDEQKKMHKLVRKVADKNARMVPKFKEAHPDCAKSASRFSDQYNKIIMEAMGGKGDNDFEKEEKIIRKVSKEVIVEKDL